MKVPKPNWGNQNVLVVVNKNRPRRVHLKGRVLGLDDTLLYGSASVYVNANTNRKRESHTGLRPGGRITTGSPPGTVDVRVTLGHEPNLRTVWEVTGVEVPPKLEFAPESLRRPLPAAFRVAKIRLVDRAGQPYRGAWRYGMSAPVIQVIVPKEGEVLEIPELLQRVNVKGDCELVCDPVDVPVFVDGLPKNDRVVFGLSVRAAGGGEHPEGGFFHTKIVPLRAGRGRMFVPRGAPLVARLHVHWTRLEDRDRNGGGMRYPAAEGFEGEFTIPAAGPVKSPRFSSPKGPVETWSARGR